MREIPRVACGTRIVVKNNAPYCNGQQGTVMYVGDDGVSVAIDGLDIDYMIFNHDEYEIVKRS